MKQNRYFHILNTGLQVQVLSNNLDSLLQVEGPHKTTQLHSQPLLLSLRGSWIWNGADTPYKQEVERGFHPVVALCQFQLYLLISAIHTYNVTMSSYVVQACVPIIYSYKANNVVSCSYLYVQLCLMIGLNYHMLLIFTTCRQ